MRSDTLHRNKTRSVGALLLAAATAFAVSACKSTGENPPEQPPGGGGNPGDAPGGGDPGIPDNGLGMGTDLGAPNSVVTIPAA